MFSFIDAPGSSGPAAKKNNIMCDLAMALDADDKWYHIPGLRYCETYEQFSLILSRYCHPSRSSTFYWNYGDKRPQLKISRENYQQGLEDEGKGLCFIYVEYYEESPFASLTVENLLRHSSRYTVPDLSKTSSKISSNSKTSLSCKKRESFICRCCHYQGESVSTEAAHILEIKEIEAVNKKHRKNYLLQKFGLERINGEPNLICLCQVCHKFFDDQLLKLNPDNMRWEVNPNIQSECSGVNDMTYARLHGTKCDTKVILNRQALKHRYQRQSKEVNMDELSSDLLRLGLH